MASQLLLRIAAELQPAGLDQLKGKMADVRNEAQRAAMATSEVGSSLKNMSQIIAGTVLTLPLVGFIKEAIRSEEVTARFNMQLASLGETMNSFQIEALSTKVRNLAGITQTELVQALGSGLKYFKDMDKELSLLNTAIGMTKMTGVSLATAFQQLGYITMGYGTRIARQYGVSMHTEIRNPTARAAAIIEDMTAKMEPLAKQTGTTAEAFKIFGASVKDYGEKAAEGMLKPLADLVNLFNKMPEWLKAATVEMVIFTGAVVGLTIAFNALGASIAKAGMGTIAGQLGWLSTLKIGLKDLLPLLSLVGTALAPLVVPLTAIAAGIGLFLEYKMLKSKKDLLEGIIKAQEKTEADFSKKALEFDERNIDYSIGLEDKFEDKLREVNQTTMLLYKKEFDYRQKGIQENLINSVTAASKIAEANRRGMEETIENLKKYNIFSLSDYQKFTFKMEDLRISALKDGLDKELQLHRLKALQEAKALEKAYGDHLEIRKALTEKSAMEEVDIRKKYMAEEVSYALMSYQERLRFDKDYAKAKEVLEYKRQQDLIDLSEREKALVRDTAGGKKALGEWETKDAMRQAELEKNKVAKITELEFFKEEKPALDININLNKPSEGYIKTMQMEEVVRTVSDKVREWAALQDYINKYNKAENDKRMPQ